MAFVYFRKDDQRFSHVSNEPTGESWLDEFEVPGASYEYMYSLSSDNEVVQGEARPLDVSAAPSIAEFNLMGLRAARDQRLAATDWWAVADRTMTPEQVIYRQALRDITEQYGSVAEVVWPELPN